MSDIADFLEYNFITGNFYWKDSGKKAGTVNKNGYVHIKFKNKIHKGHRLAFYFMNEKVPKLVDHRNQNKSCNTWINLREATKSQNQFNKNYTNKTGKKGITFDPRRNKYMVQVSGWDGKRYRGMYESLELAELVATEARNKFQGEFANHG